MALELNNKTALITGATGKLTRHLVSRLSGAGMKLALQYHANRTLAEELLGCVEASGGSGKAYAIDLVDLEGPAELARTVLADFGRVDLLINAASGLVFRRLAHTDNHLWTQMLDLNLSAPFRLIRALESNFRRGPGAILNFVDIWGLKPKPAMLAYGVAKAGLIALTKALAEEFAPETTVNALAPGLVHFPPDVSDLQREKILRRIPLQRTAHPDEVVDLAMAMLTNRYLTGQVFTLDGGRTLV